VFIAVVSAFNANAVFIAVVSAFNANAVFISVVSAFNANELVNCVELILFAVRIPPTAKLPLIFDQLAVKLPVVWSPVIVAFPETANVAIFVVPVKVVGPAKLAFKFNEFVKPVFVKVPLTVKSFAVVVPVNALFKLFAFAFNKVSVSVFV
jgi:hypothetical protein